MTLSGLEAIRRTFFRGRTTVYAAISFAGVAAYGALSSASGSSLFSAIVLFIVGMLLLPWYVKRCVALEDAVNLRTGLLVPGRILRASASSLPVVASMLAARIDVTVVPWLGFLLCAGSAGAQAVASRLAYRGFEDRVSNSVAAYAYTLWILPLAHHPSSGLAGIALLGAAASVFVLDLFSGLRSDIASRSHRKGGVGIFFGTFNPVHRTHIDIIRTAICERQLDRVYVHPTTVPKLHRDAIASGELQYDYQDGMRVYSKTEKADPNKNYFPTGNMFYEYVVRNELLKASIRDAGLDGAVYVLELPDLYERQGFFGVARHIKSLHQGSLFHGLHGSDPGGMWVRNIFEACGRIVPYPVPRKDAISATAIRKGASGMTTPTVELFLASVRSGKPFVFSNGFEFKPGGASKRARDATPSSSSVGETEIVRTASVGQLRSSP